MIQTISNTISISISLITGCLEMKRGTAQSGRMWDNKETFSIRNGITTYMKIIVETIITCTQL